MGWQACCEDRSRCRADALPDRVLKRRRSARSKIKTPLLPNPLEGEAYLAAQNANPFGCLVALYLVAEDPVSGVLVKLAGEVMPDPVTGQLVSTFKNTPQLPFEDLEAALLRRCASAAVHAGVCVGHIRRPRRSRRGRAKPRLTRSSTSRSISGPNGSPCTNPLPFAPSLTAGTTSIQAGGFSPFTMTMSRPDGSQNLQAVQLKMPPGLLGTLATVKLCNEAQANAGTCGAGKPDRAHDRQRRCRWRSLQRHRRRSLHHRRLRGRSVRPVDREPRQGRAVRPRQGDRQSEDRSRPDHGGADDHDRHERARTRSPRSWTGSPCRSSTST